MKKLLYIIPILFAILTSCEEYLDEKTSKTDEQEITSVDDIDLLLNNTYDLWYGTHLTSDINFANISDDCSIRAASYNAIGNWVDYSVLENYVWKDYITTNIDEGWTNAYKQMWIANYIITKVDELEGTENEKKQLKAEAHLIKAYKLLSLTMKYCLYPSENNANEQGLPIKNTVEFEEIVERSSLSSTIDEIEKHIIEGLKIEKERTVSWRESTASANALAARFYLYIHDFEQADFYAQKTISLYNYMVNMETEVPIMGEDYPTPITAYNSPFSKTFFEGWESQIKIQFVDQYFFFPDNGINELYEENDLRSYFYSKKYLEGYYGVSEKLFSKFSGAVMTGTDVAEMYLILAECAARKNNLTKCMENIEKVRINRFNADTYKQLSIPTTTKEAIQNVIDERRREFPFTSSRWSDLKRLNNEGLLDPITITRNFYEMEDGSINTSVSKQYTLKPNSRKYARPIPREVIDLTNGVVKQNTY